MGELRKGEREAARRHRLEEYRKRTSVVKTTIQQIEIQIDNTIDDFFDKIKNCMSSESCTAIKSEFNIVLRQILDEFEDVVLEVEIINADVNEQEGTLSLKDEVMKETSSKNTRLETLANDIWLKVDDAISEYMSLGRNIDVSSSARVIQLKQKKERSYEILKNVIPSIADEVYSQLNNATTEERMLEIKTSMENRYIEVEQELQAIRRGMDT